MSTPNSPRSPQRRTKLPAVPRLSRKNGDPTTVSQSAVHSTSVPRAKWNESIPLHCGIPDLCAWFDNLAYHSRNTLARRSEARQREQQGLVGARRKFSEGSRARSLMALSSALRADMHVFVNYLVEFMKGHRGTYEIPMALPSKDAYHQLKELFEVLDMDRSGTLTLDELQRASTLLGSDEELTALHFRKLDSNRSGCIDFLEMLKAFFPNASMKQLARIHREYSRSPSQQWRIDVEEDGGARGGKRRLPSAIAGEVASLYHLFSSRPGGCSFANMLSFMSVDIQQRAQDYRDVFELYDQDKDGVLSEDEFAEMLRHTYPPYVPATPWNVPEGAFSMSWFVRRTAPTAETLRQRLPQLSHDESPARSLPILAPYTARDGMSVRVRTLIRERAAHSMSPRPR